MTSPHRCLVLMPFGTKTDVNGAPIHFDDIYRTLVEPAIRAASLDPVRTDMDIPGGIIYQSIFEQLVTCEFVIADLTIGNPNVFYELGIRHASRPAGTTLICAESRRVPFDLASFRFLTYSLDSSGVSHDLSFVNRLTDHLIKGVKENIPDSPVYTFVPDLKPPGFGRSFAQAAPEQESANVKEKLATARRSGPGMMYEIELSLGDLEKQDSALVVDLFLSYRYVKAWDRMIALVDKMSPTLKATEMVQQQLALALNRAGQPEKAEAVLSSLLQQRGPNSETYGLLGRIYKDQWTAAVHAGDSSRATSFLNKAIEAYLRGFESDWRDAYPGINAVTLMEFQEHPDERQKRILPVVQYAMERRLASGNVDYWDHATQLELAVLANDEKQAMGALTDVLIAADAEWETETTARNLRLIRQAREKRGEDTRLSRTAEAALMKDAAKW